MVVLQTSKFEIIYADTIHFFNSSVENVRIDADALSISIGLVISLSASPRLVLAHHFLSPFVLLQLFVWMN